jgi:DNA-binding response OmpR family regulator
MSVAHKNSPRLIYVVDDNPLLGQVTAQIIDTEGYKTRFFTDPMVAQQALIDADPQPDILLTDYDLGPIVGFDLIKTAREHIPDILCLLVSGTVKHEILQRHPIKPDEFLAKPFKADELLACINELAVR